MISENRLLILAPLALLLPMALQDSPVAPGDPELRTALARSSPAIVEKAKDKEAPCRASGVELIAEGSSSSVDKPFVYVARSKGALRDIKDLIGTDSAGLNSFRKIDFKREAVIAVFAGTKNTGGYSVSVRKDAGKLCVGLVAPPDGALVTEALTRPFKIVAVPAAEEDPVSIGTDANWSKAVNRFDVTKGSFSFAGGFAGFQTKFSVGGWLNVIRYGNLVTVGFHLHSIGSEKARSMSDIGSGRLTGSALLIERLEGGSFITRPHPPLKISADLSGGTLTMSFEPGKRDYVVSDGYVGRGTLKAVNRP